jgi:hypothetical protein
MVIADTVVTMASTLDMELDMYRVMVLATVLIALRLVFQAVCLATFQGIRRDTVLVTGRARLGTISVQEVLALQIRY